MVKYVLPSDLGFATIGCIFSLNIFKKAAANWWSSRACNRKMVAVSKDALAQLISKWIAYRACVAYPIYPERLCIMSFRDNLQHLRSTRNMTQEQLAMLVGVSRQSVTKWEAERAYPEMDKLIKICDIFDCTIDDLVSGDLTQRPSDPALSVPAKAALADVCGYDEHKRKTAFRIALGIALIILGVAAGALFEGATSQLGIPDAGSGVGLFVFVAAGLLVLLPAIFTNSAYTKAHPFVEDFYTSEQKEQVRRAFGRELAAGIAIIVLALAMGALFDNNISHAVFFVLVAVGVFCIVHAAFLEDRIDVEDYNLGALVDLSNEEVAGLVGEERAPSVIERLKTQRKLENICGIIMLVATILGLVSMFYGFSEGGFFERYFWIFWMVGGLLCAIAAIVVHMRSGE